jgi:N4-gp56 family major capsid protein
LPDAYTGVGAVAVDQTAYDLAVYHGLRPMLYFDSLADVRSTNQSFNGSAVVFTISTDLSPATTTLNESTDVNAVALSDSQITLTLAEYGNAVLVTKLLRSESFVPFDPVAANAVAWNAGLSQDYLAVNILQAGTNVLYGTGSGGSVPTSRATVEANDTLAGNDTRKAVAKLRGNNVMDFGGFYAGFMHPDVSYDFQGATGGANWRDPHTYSAPDAIWNGEIGAFQGVRFVETATAPKFADAGSSTTLTDVYRTMIMGRQALAKAYSHADGNGAYPIFVPGPVVDKLRRNVPLGWYWIGAYGIFRQQAIYGIETASSIGAN